LLRERRSTTLAHMQDVALEVESNILATYKLSKSDRDRRKKKKKKPHLYMPQELIPKLMN
jgi:hypothetical protein